MSTKITHAYLDLDAVAYTGASIAEKMAYQWKKNDGTDESEVIEKAKDAKDWMEAKVTFDGEDEADWTRHKLPQIQPVEIAFKGVKYEMDKWLKSVKDLTGNPDIIFKGWLTSSGRKIKDVDGLEDRYQHNRYVKRHPEWESKPKPIYLEQCRSHMIQVYDWISMSPEGIEADALVVSFAERRGMSAVAGFKDKDLKQMMNTNYIDMNPSLKGRELVSTDTIGTIKLKESMKGAKSIDSSGFLCIAVQTIQGDSSDGYKGVKGMGPVAVYNLFKDCLTPEDCCETLVSFYRERFADGHSYKDWSEQPQERTWEQLLIQHMNLAYHERSSKETTNPIERYLKGEPIIYEQ